MITFPLHVAILLLPSLMASEPPGLGDLLSRARTGDYPALSSLACRTWSAAEARQIVGEMIPLIERDIHSSQGLAVTVIRQIRSKHPAEALPALPALVRLLDHRTGRRDLEAVIKTVGEFGKDAASAVPDLRKLLDGFDNDTDRTYYPIWATAALAKIEPAEEKWVKWLAERLLKGTNFERPYTLQALAYVGSSAKAAMPDLRAVLKDRNPVIRTLAAGALWRIDREASSTIPVLVEALSSKEEYGLDPWGPSSHTMPLCAYACFVLGDMGSLAKSVIPELRKAQQSGDNGPSAWATTAIERIERDGKEAAGSRR